VQHRAAISASATSFHQRNLDVSAAMSPITATDIEQNQATGQ
jgi:hypothetical protein